MLPLPDASRQAGMTLARFDFIVELALFPSGVIEPNCFRGSKGAGPMRIIKTVAALSSMLIFSGLAAAQVVSSGQPARPEPGSIRGRVLMPNGAPVAEAIKVTLHVLRGEQSVLYTDSEGLFEIDSLAPGSYTVEAEDDRRSEERRVGKECRASGRAHQESKTRD